VRVLRRLLQSHDVRQILTEAILAEFA